MQRYTSHFIDGQWQEGDSQATIDVINPANGKLVTTTAAANNQDIDAAVKAAKRAFPAWSQSPASERADLINTIADHMQGRLDDFAQAISETMGCPKHLAIDIQVKGSIYAFRSFADLAHKVEEVEQLKRVMQTYSPVGVCVLINPWNYPLSQLVGKLGPALAAGCTSVAKPAEQTPLQDLILAEIFAEIGAPAGIFNVITGVGHEIGDTLCSHSDVDMVSFTGSTAAGIKVAQSAAPTVKRVCQELGGKSPYIITEDADLEAAVRYGVEDVMLNSGQTCSALTRMLVHQNHYADAVEIAKRIAEENVVGDPMDDQSSMGPLSSKTQQKRVRGYIEKGIEEGARLVTGGVDVPEHLSDGAYVMPTIFADVTNQMTIAREEIFGPVLCMIPYRDEDEAVEIANDTDYGLSSGVYAHDTDAALKLARKIRAGQCYIQGSYFTTRAPFGGFKQSGNGREWGEEGLREYLEVRAVITK